MSRHYTREIPQECYKTLEADVYEDEEFYIYKASGYELVRKKIGGWINLTKFLPFIDPKDAKVAKKDIEGYKTFFKFTDIHVQPRYEGIWVRLKDARVFADAYKILEKTTPILAFERIAKVSYHGIEFYEYFCSIDYETNIRVLRDVQSNKINMKQIFICYTKLKSDKKNIAIQERNFYNYYRDYYGDKITVKNDSSLCGGFWIPYTDARLYTSKHGFLKRLLPILDFEKSPSEAKEYPVDTFQGSQRRYWRATTCDDDFHGFPMSFSGGGAPSRPINKRRFRMDEITNRRVVRTDITRQNFQTDYSITLVKRLSDGWVNASTVVKLGCMIRVKELNFGKSDPEMVKLAEMYYRDQIQNFKNESITSPVSKVLNGKWCSRRDIREICKELKLYSNDYADPIIEFINEGTQSESESESGDEEIEVLAEDKFEDDKSGNHAQDIFHLNYDQEDKPNGKGGSKKIEHVGLSEHEQRPNHLLKNTIQTQIDLIRGFQQSNHSSSFHEKPVHSQKSIKILKMPGKLTQQLYPYGTSKASHMSNYPYPIPKRPSIEALRQSAIPAACCRKRTPFQMRTCQKYSTGSIFTPYDIHARVQPVIFPGNVYPYPHFSYEPVRFIPRHEQSFRFKNQNTTVTHSMHMPTKTINPTVKPSVAPVDLIIKELDSIEQSTIKSKKV